MKQPLASMLILLVVASFASSCAQEFPVAPRDSGRVIVEDFGTAEIRISPKTLRALGLTPASTPDEVRAIVIRHGVQLAPEDKIRLWKRGSAILIASHTKQWDQLKAILAGLNKEER